MKLNRVLVVIKPHSATPRAARAPKAHADALASVATHLVALGIPHRVAARDRVPARHGADLIIPVGGDGTFLAAAHAAGATPLLGVNSEPARSVGFFCAATPATFRGHLAGVLAGRRRPRALPLIEAAIDGKKLPVLALNDLLFAGRSPAETVRYELRVGTRREAQRSSGVWIAAGPGSTAAIRSAGGRAQPLCSRRLQFLVREPCAAPRRPYRLARGILPAGGRIALTSLMAHGMVYLDGHWHAYPVPPGATVTCKISKKTVKVFL